MSAWPKSHCRDDSRDSLVFAQGTIVPPAAQPAGAVAGFGTRASGLRDLSEFKLLGAEINPRAMNGQQVGQLQRVTIRSQRKVAGASRRTRGLWTGFQSRFFSNQGCPTIKLFPTSWAS
jgi:hypothetical protein